MLVLLAVAVAHVTAARLPSAFAAHRPLDRDAPPPNPVRDHLPHGSADRHRGGRPTRRRQARLRRNLFHHNQNMKR